MDMFVAVFLPNRVVNDWYWHIFEVRFEMRDKCSLISCNFLLFTRNLFNFFLTFVSILLVASTILLANCSIILLAFVSILLIVFGSIVLLAIILLFSSFLSKGIWIFSWRYSSLRFCFFCGFILSLLTVMFATLYKCTVLCSGYTARLSDSLWQISI